MAIGTKLRRRGDASAPPAPPTPSSKPAKPRLKKLRILFVLLGLSVLALVSMVFGMMAAVSQDLPAIYNFAQYKASKNSEVFDASGEPIGTLTSDQNKILLTSGQISPNIKNAVVSIEDSRFYEHNGVDFQGIARALIKDVLSQSAAQGASTITEQFVKNALEAEGSRTVFEKFREAALAYRLERHWTKDKILTEYLNTIYFGEGAYDQSEMVIKKLLAEAGAVGIGDEDGGYIVHSKRSEYFARCVQGERYGHLVLGSILPQVFGVRPQTGCDSEPAQAGISRQSAELLAGAAAGCGNLRPCGREVGLAPRRQKDQDGELVLRGTVLKLEALSVEGVQGPLGQQIADSNGRQIVVRNDLVRSGRAMRTAGVGGVHRCARSRQGRLELLVGEMANVPYPAVTSDDDVRGRDPEMEGCPQAAVVEYDGHGDAELLAVGADGLDGVVESDVDGDDGQIRSRRFVGVLEMRHLLPAGHAPSCPKLQIHGLLAVKAAEIDHVAIDGVEREPRRGRAQDRTAGLLRALLTGYFRERRRGADQQAE